MGRVSQKSKKKRRQNAIKSIILRPIYDERREQIAQNNRLSMMGIDNLKAKPKNAFLYPQDPEAVFFQREPEAILDVRVEKNPEAALEYEQRRTENKFKNKFFGKREFARLAEDEMEQELLDGFKKMEVGDDARAEERDEDMDDLVDAMGRLQIHDKVKASRCKFSFLTPDRKNKQGGMVSENPATANWKAHSQKYNKLKTKAAKHKRF